MKPPISDATHASIKENKIISSCLKFIIKRIKSESKNINYKKKLVINFTG